MAELSMLTIRGLSANTVNALGAHAKRCGLSREKMLRRLLTNIAQDSSILDFLLEPVMENPEATQANTVSINLNDIPSEDMVLEEIRSLKRRLRRAIHLLWVSRNVEKIREGIHALNTQ